MRQDRVTNAELDQRLQRLGRDRRLGQPQTVGAVAEAAVEVVQPPHQLRARIARVRERDDRVRIRLRDRPAAAQPLALRDVGLAQPRLGRRVMPPQPARQRRPEVERDTIVVVDDRLDAAGAVVDARERVRAVALGVDARVPVVKRRRRRLARHPIRPRVLTRRLVEMSVDAEGDRRR